MGEPARLSHGPPDEATRRLRAVLGLLAADPEVLRARMTRTAHDPAGALALVIGEIDETVLPRRIEIVSQAGCEAALHAANRRLIDIDLPLRAGDAAPGGVDPEDIALHHVKTVAGLAARLGALTLRTGGRAASARADGGSCSAVGLLQAARSIGREDGMARWLGRIAPRLGGWILRTGDRQQRSARMPEQVARALELVDTRTDEMRRRDGEAGRLDRAEPTCAIHPATHGLRIMVARDARATLIAAIPEAETAAILEDWRRVFGGP